MTTLKARTPAEWASILSACGVRRPAANRWGPAFSDELVDDALSAGEAELDDFLGQILHESCLLERVEEDLHYSTPGRLMTIWPGRFATIADEAPYRRNPEALANKVYGGRMGNRYPGDGWRFRGRGLVMVTGRDNYALCTLELGVDLIERPDLLCEPAIALRASIRWWEEALPDALMGNLAALTKRVNGGTVGMADRRRISDVAARALQASRSAPP